MGRHVVKAQVARKGEQPCSPGEREQKPSRDLPRGKGEERAVDWWRGKRALCRMGEWVDWPMGGGLSTCGKTKTKKDATTGKRNSVRARKP